MHCDDVYENEHKHGAFMLEAMTISIDHFVPPCSRLVASISDNRKESKNTLDVVLSWEARRTAVSPKIRHNEPAWQEVATTQ